MLTSTSNRLGSVHLGPPFTLYTLLDKLLQGVKLHAQRAFLQKRRGTVFRPASGGKARYFAARASGATSFLPTMRVRQMKTTRNRAAATMPTG